MKVGIAGCCHGEWAKTYEEVAKRGEAIDLLLIAGDAQAVRNYEDLTCMACPPKYKAMHSFYEYYNGLKQAPVMTIVIGGNHEGSNHMQELFYGGWLAPNIYYLGNAGVVNFGGLRIAGLSGIYKSHSFAKDRYEHPPYTSSAQRSVYHIRKLQTEQLKLLSGKVDIFLSHDWPQSIAQHGDTEKLLKVKSFLRKEIEQDTLGSPPGKDIMETLRPVHWFAAHMHVKFEATVIHNDKESTNFLALDKCLPKRKYLEVICIECGEENEKVLSYDKEWLQVLVGTNRFLRSFQLPTVDDLAQRVTDAREAVEAAFADGNYAVPENFTPTLPLFSPPVGRHGRIRWVHPPQRGNPQTDTLLGKLGISHVPPVTIPFKQPPVNTESAFSFEPSVALAKDENEIDLDDI